MMLYISAMDHARKLKGPIPSLKNEIRQGAKE